MVKAASGVAVFLTGIGLDLIGLVGSTNETGPVAVQSAGTLLGLRLMMTVLPMIVLAAAFVLFQNKFTLTDRQVEEIDRFDRYRDYHFVDYPNKRGLFHGFSWCYFRRERVSTKQAIGNTIFRRQLNGRAWLSDPDVFFLREENLKLTAEQKRKLARVNALLGGVPLTSDDPGGCSPTAREQYRTLRELSRAENIADADRGLCVIYTIEGRDFQLSLA